jgi:hypothetical protein
LQVNKYVHNIDICVIFLVLMSLGVKLELHVIW